MVLTFARTSVQWLWSPCPGWQNLLPLRSCGVLIPASLSTTATISYSKGAWLKRISFVTRTSTPAHLAAMRSSAEKTPKCADPLLIRRTQSKRSTPMTHSMLEVSSRIGQYLWDLLNDPRPSKMQTRTGKTIEWLAWEIPATNFHVEEIKS